MLTLNELIERMTPTALAETIVSLEECRENRATDATIAVMRAALEANVGEHDAAAMIAEAR